MNAKELEKEMNRKRRGDVLLVQQMSKVRRLNGGKGYSDAYVFDVIVTERRTNAELSALYDEVRESRKKLLQPKNTRR